MRLWSLLLALAALLVASEVRAEALQAPVGARAFSLGGGRVACEPATGGWALENGGRSVRPPASAQAIGLAVQLKVATTREACRAAPSTVRLVSTAHLPKLDRKSIELFLDEGRLEMRGSELQGSFVSWPGAEGLERDSCGAVAREGAVERCAWSVPRSLPTAPGTSVLRIWPVGAEIAADAVLFDTDGRRMSPEALRIQPTKVHVAQVFPSDAAVDVSAGFGVVPLLHPDTVTGVECPAVKCGIEAGQLHFQAPHEGTNSIDVRVLLTPNVTFARPGLVVAKISVVRCPMVPVSGAAFRGQASARIVLRLEGGCARDAGSLRYLIGTRSVDVVQTERTTDATFVVLALGAVDTDEFVVSASRTGAEGAVVAVARASTRPAPETRTGLEIPGFPNIDFVPSNRSALVRIPKVFGGELALLPVEGVYAVERRGGTTWVRGDPAASGQAAFRFGFRDPSLPKPLDGVDLAVFVDPLQRPIKEANVPAPFGPSAMSATPLVELLCYDADRRTRTITPGIAARFPYELRDGCRVVFHRERLSPESGTQRVQLEIDVHKVDGSPRADAHIGDTIVLRSGSEPRIAWIKGVGAPYDRVTVRISHLGDETHYLGAQEVARGAPAAQWAVLFGTGRVRLYATTAIPTGLYRFGGSSGSGTLALNFGVISRLTWLDSNGKEGLLGLEGGIMAFGLTGSTSATGQPLTQVGAVMGIGLAVPIANQSTATQAAINLHAWVEQRITGGVEGQSPQAIIFGPSISIGNVGTTF